MLKADIGLVAQQNCHRLYDCPAPSSVSTSSLPAAALSAGLRTNGLYPLMQVKLGVEAERYREVMAVRPTTVTMSLAQKCLTPESDPRFIFWSFGALL